MKTSILSQNRETVYEGNSMGKNVVDESNSYEIFSLLREKHVKSKGCMIDDKEIAEVSIRSYLSTKHAFETTLQKHAFYLVEACF